MPLGLNPWIPSAILICHGPKEGSRRKGETVLREGWVCPCGS